ncbi:alpha/beta hydrolase [Sphingomicrobium aestuariivivum]|uniref:alpha/beta hydrolase n=1 Tax=Sphingomicrobium aestuariivivum TaxID=1582356 RepID=UPI001FD6B7E4|nr:alpha/beta hydrolase-fold protein [Sphingomicrobium aestuariivivum]MCJ8191489.1 alpha/beta hydrolase-fold protein [Sphingomicrobium aestuariivivum]
MFLALSLAAANLAAEAAPLVIGEQHVFEAVGAERQVNVVLPASYGEDPQASYPVVYMLDGGRGQDLLMGAGIANWNAMWGRSEEAILVGVETSDRQRELLPPTGDAEEAERYPTAGEREAFRAYLAETVIPTVEAGYRTDGRRYLVGESAAGHFVVESWAYAPTLFTGYAAISPSLQWNGQALSKTLGEADLTPRAPLYLSLASEGGTFEAGVMRLAASLGDAQPHCFSDRREDLDHGTSLHGLLPEALQYLMPTEADWLEEYGMVLRCESGGPLSSD